MLVERTRDDSMAKAFGGLLPSDNSRDTRFAIQFLNENVSFLNTVLVGIISYFFSIRTA